MTYRDLITDYILENGASYPDEIYRAKPILNWKYLLRVFRKMVKDRELKLTPSGFYVRARYRYKSYRHAKRLIDTHSTSPKNRWDSEKMDLELTCEGTAPRRAKMSTVDSVVNPKMVQAALRTLAREGILLVGPGDVGFGYTEWNVTGSQWLSDLHVRHNPRWLVEIKFVNNVGAHYTWHTSFTVRVKEFGK